MVIPSLLSHYSRNQDKGKKCGKNTGQFQIQNFSQPIGQLQDTEANPYGKGIK